MRRRCSRSWLAKGVLAIGLMSAAHAWAVCTKVNYSPSTAKVEPWDPQYVDPAYGSHNVWLGAQTYAGTSGLSASTVNITTSAFQPDGTLLAHGSASFLDMGAETYAADQVLFRCDAADGNDLFEFYAVDARNWYSGLHEDGARGGLVPSGYRTFHNGMLIRLTHAASGNYFKSTWQSRRLTGLERDGQGKILVKAKNFSGVQVELIRFSNESFSGGVGGTGPYPLSGPSGHVAFKGGGISSGLSVGASSATAVDGWPYLWPGAINLSTRITVQRAATCAVTSVTPNITFPLITVSELDGGGHRQLPIDIDFQCLTGSLPAELRSPFQSGTAAGRTAMGVLIPPANHQSAVAEHLVLSAGGVRFLLSDNYGLPGVTGGVGVELSYATGGTMYFLGNDQATGGGISAGWYPVLDGASRTHNESGGVTRFTKRLNAILKKIPGKTVTPGRFNARAQVVIRVQ